MKIEYFTDEVKGLSKVTITYKNKIFTGIAKKDPVDIWSSFAGLTLAEMRAFLKLKKYEYKQAKERAEVCRKFVESLKQYKKFDPNSDTAKAVFRQLNCRIKEVNAIGDEITNLELSIMKYLTGREKVLKSLKDKKDKNV